MVSIVSLNVANSHREEMHYPLYTRLAPMISLLRPLSPHLYCFQELRGTGTYTSAMELAEALASGLGESYSYVIHPCNSSKNPLYLGVLYDRSRGELLGWEPVPVTIPGKRRYSLYALLLRYRVDERELTVVNIHAPYLLSHRLLYLQHVLSCFEAHPQAIVVGDANRLPQEREQWEAVVPRGVRELVQDRPTFSSYPCDTQADGSRWVSSLDSVYVQDREKVVVEVLSPWWEGSSAVQVSDHHPLLIRC